MAHHQEAGDIHAEIARRLDMLPRDIRFGAMRRDTDRPDAHSLRPAQILDGSDARQEQRRDDGRFDGLADRFDPCPVGAGTETVIEAGAGEAVAMRDLDRIDAGLVQRAGDGAHMI
jgi:hypothetical protein